MLNVSVHTVAYKNVIIDEGDKQYDEGRWLLLAWIFDLGPEFVKNLLKEPKASTLHVAAIVLRYLLAVGVSTEFEHFDIFHIELECVFVYSFTTSLGLPEYLFGIKRFHANFRTT